MAMWGDLLDSLDKTDTAGIIRDRLRSLTNGRSYLKLVLPILNN
jgi:hypothetical protein